MARLKIALLLLSVVLIASPAFASEVWFAPAAPFPVPVTGPSGSKDYLDLFQPDAAWKTAALGIKVFKMSTQAVQIAPDEVLARILKDLKSRNIEFAIEGLMLSTGPQGCGMGIEGYSGPQALAFDAAKIKRLGGVLYAVAMDEPLWFGHFQDGPKTCHSSIDDVAANAAKSVAALRAIFPNVLVGDIEPITSFMEAGFADTIRQWSNAFALATGQKLAFFDADLDWSKPWRARLLDFVATLKPQQISFGVIYDGDPEDGSDLDWTMHAQERFVTVESDPATRPDRAIVQSWMVHPAVNLPDTKPGTLSNLVVQYLKPPPGLTINRTPSGFAGRLMDEAGHPVAGAAIAASIYDPSGIGLPSAQSFSRTVPADTVSALVALRINNECACSGVANIALGDLTFDQDGQAPIVIHAARILGAAPAGESAVATPFGPMQLLTVSLGQRAQRDSQPFPVTPGAPYTLRIQARISAASAGSGYFAVIFLDRSGKEMRRDEFPLQTGEVALAGGRTDGDGNFSVALQNGQSEDSLAIAVRFAGDAKLRPAETTLR